MTGKVPVKQRGCFGCFRDKVPDRITMRLRPWRSAA